MGLLVFATIIASMTSTLSAQAKAPAQPTLTLAIPGFPDGGQVPVKCTGRCRRRGHVAGDELGQRSRWHAIVSSNNEWRVRVGDYRVVYEIDDTGRTVDVTRIAHRRQVYE